MKILFLLLFFLPVTLYAQFIENWDYSSFQEQELWQGNITKFNTSDNIGLLLDAEPETSDAYLFRECKPIDNTTWKFSVELNFNPSSSNYAQVFLVSSHNAYTDDIEGYFIKIGDTQDDISLWKRQNGKNTKIIDGEDKVISENHSIINVTVYRDEIGNWSVSASVNDINIGTQNIFDDSIIENQFTGIYCKYTSTRSKGFRFDSFSVDGTWYVDEEPPVINTHKLINGTTYELEFSESLDSESINADCFEMDNLVKIDSIVTEETTIILHLNNYLQDTSDGKIQVKNIKDLAGNVITSTSIHYQYNRLNLHEYSIENHQNVKFKFSKTLNKEEATEFILVDNNIIETKFINDSTVICTYEKSFANQIPFQIRIRNLYDGLGDVIKDTTIQCLYHKPTHPDYSLYEDWIYPELSTQNIWCGDTAFFLTRSEKLLLNAPEGDELAYLFHPCEAIDNCTWEIDMNLPFNPSASNKVQIFLSALQQTPIDSIEGYYLEIGNTDDDISLWKNSERTKTKIIDGVDGLLSNTYNQIHIEVTRDDMGNWKLETIVNDIAQNPLIAFDNDIKNSRYFGIAAHYTASRNKALQLGKITIKGEAYTDSRKPTIVNHHIENSQTLWLTLDEAIDSESIQKSCIIAPDNNPVKQLRYFNDSIWVNFINPLQNDTAGFIQIKQLCDTAGNIMADTLLTYNYHKAKRYDVLITEIMTDASPSQDLPEAEYIELYNNTDMAFDLQDWQLIINQQKLYNLPPYKLEAHSHMIVTDKTFTDITNAIRLQNTFSLNNSSGSITIICNEQTTIDAVQYPFAINQETFKADGGWSYEKIDYANQQHMGNNWDYSVCLDGGTPGYGNSLAGENPDIVAPTIQFINYINDSTFSVCFSESMNPASVLLAEFPFQISTNLDSTFLKQLFIHIQEPIDTNVIYPFSFTEIPKDYTGNILNDTHKFQLGIPASIKTNALLITEILFNPHSDGFDFVEIYNNSDDIINCNDIYFASQTENNIEKLFPINNNGQLLFPQNYMVACADTSYLTSHYPNCQKENLLQTNLPTLPDDSGNIAICNSKGYVWDYFEYNEEMQHALLANNEGVSLERIYLNSPTNNPDNWHSASSTSNYATPTLQNSQYQNSEPQLDLKSFFQLESKEFSPNNDGFQDILLLHYQMEQAGWMANIKIYNTHGILVKQLASCELLGIVGTFTWNGISDNNSRCNIGPYIIYINLYDNKGSTRTEKIVAILASTHQ